MIALTPISLGLSSFLFFNALVYLQEEPVFGKVPRSSEGEVRPFSNLDCFQIQIHG